MSFLLRDGERLDDLGKGMKIIQDPSAPCFAIDAVLLADFVRPQTGARIIDLGTGTGIVPLLLSRWPGCLFEALELMPKMADMAGRSVAGNGLERRIHVRQGDIRSAAMEYGPASFDGVVMNPPYYKLGCGRLNRDELRAAARSEKYCTLEQAIAVAAAVLKPGGWCCLVQRAERQRELLTLAPAYGLFPCRLRPVRPSPYKPANLFLVELGTGRTEQAVLLPPLTVYDKPQHYSEEMEAIYRGREGTYE